MFAMYDDDGLNFRSTIDHLYDVHEISKSQVVKNDLKNKDGKNFNEFYKGNIDQEAKTKYQQIANLDTRVEIFHVEQIMSHNPFIINDSVTIGECYEMMQENKLRQLLIRSNSKNANHLKSMISSEDLLTYIMDNGGLLEEILNEQITQITKKNIITTDPISDIRRVAKVMVDFNINAIPVVDSENRILGVVSKYDVVAAVSSIPALQIWA